ncbi:hypothetical protein AB0M43_02960 [Longispora sp. NPDC051575]|uniref:hypothetical protein n=1 Tax=Longispora sp. NPDC051575 TaxID=3154943 RepID=UPI00342E8A1E
MAESAHRKRATTQESDAARQREERVATEQPGPLGEEARRYAARQGDDRETAGDPRPPES